MRSKDLGGDLGRSAVHDAHEEAAAGLISNLEIKMGRRSDSMEGDLEKPLVVRPKPVFYPNCPGCKVVQKHHIDDSLPTKELSVIALLVVCNTLPIASLYPFIYFMVEDFHIAEKKEDIGYYVGALGSAFMIGRCLTSVFWGMVADRFGRKSVILTGVMSVIVFGTGFGLSTNFWFALAMRFLLGSFNGMLATVKAYSTEICSEKHQAVGISTVGTFWGLGLIIGPALGGYLSQPSIKFPAIFPPGSLFDRYPYLMPSACTTVIAIAVFIISIQLPETLHKHHGSKPYEESEEDSDGNASRQGWAKSTHEDDGGATAAEPDAMEKAPVNGQGVAVALPVEVSNVDDIEQPLLNNYRGQGEKSGWLLFNHPLMASITAYCFWCLQDIAYTEIFSLWCVSPRFKDGLGYSTNDVGSVLAFSGFGMLVFQLLFFPFVANFLGPILTVRIGAALSIPLMAVLPSYSLLDGELLWVIVCASSVLRFIFSVTTLTGSFMLINNSVSQSQRGAANGLSMSLASAFKGVGPALGGAIFAWAQNRKDAYILPGNQLVWFFLGLISFITAISTVEPILPRSTNDPYVEEF